MSDENSAKNIQYLEMDEQRSLSDSSGGNSESNDLYGSYLSKNITIFGKLFIGFMCVSFVSSILFLVFSYTPYGAEFLRGLQINIF